MFMLFIEIFFNDSFLLYNKILFYKKMYAELCIKIVIIFFVVVVVIVVELTNINMVYMEIKRQREGWAVDWK